MIVKVLIMLIITTLPIIMVVLLWLIVLSNWAYSWWSCWSLWHKINVWQLSHFHWHTVIVVKSGSSTAMKVTSNSKWVGEPGFHACSIDKKRILVALCRIMTIFIILSPFNHHARLKFFQYLVPRIFSKFIEQDIQALLIIRFIITLVRIAWATQALVSWNHKSKQ